MITVAATSQNNCMQHTKYGAGALVVLLSESIVSAVCLLKRS